MSASPLVAVIQYPGSNCEYETAACVRASGLDCAIVRWNTPPVRLLAYDAFILPGGFSFQDRIRAGAIAAKEEITGAVCDAAADGKPVLGICNGAQILVESGLVPGWGDGAVEAALAANLIPGRSGYYSSWVFVTPGPGSGRSPWLAGVQGPLPLPVAHAEGRFVLAWDVAQERLDSSGATGLVYCDPAGADAGLFPWNPNGSWRSLAGLLNPSGNVLAMMPHPERAFMLWQVPPALEGPWGEARRAGPPPDARGPGAALFCSLAAHLGRRA